MIKSKFIQKHDIKKINPEIAIKSLKKKLFLREKIIIIYF